MAATDTTRPASRARALVRSAARSRDATRLGTALLTGSAAAFAVMAIAIETWAPLRRPGESPESLALALLVGVLAAAAVWRGTALGRAQFVSKLDRELGLGGALEVAYEGAERPGRFQELLERRVDRARPSHAQRASELPWRSALVAAGLAAWFVVAATERARSVAPTATRSLLAQAAADLAAVGVAGTPSDAEDAAIAAIARATAAAARSTAALDGGEIRTAEEALAELASALPRDDPRSAAVEAARIALDGARAGLGVARAAPGAGVGVDGADERAPGARAAASGTGASAPPPSPGGSTDAAAAAAGERVTGDAAARSLDPDAAAVVELWFRMRR